MNKTFQEKANQGNSKLHEITMRSEASDEKKTHQLSVMVLLFIWKIGILQQCDGEPYAAFQWRRPTEDLRFHIV